MVKRRTVGLVMVAAVAIATVVSLTAGAHPANAFCVIVCIPLQPTNGTPGIGTGTASIPVSPVIGGGDYVGHGSRPRYLMSIMTAQNATAVSRADVEFTAGSCSDGGSYSSSLTVAGRTPISAAATATVSRAGIPATVGDRSGHRHHGSESASLRLGFHGLQLSGTMTVRFRAGRFSCNSGNVGLVGARAGSAGAPFFTAAVGSGNYAGRLRSGRWNASVYVPLAVLSSEQVPWQITCARQHLSGNATFSEVPINGTGFSDQTGGQRSLRGGLTAAITNSSNGRFSATAPYSFGGGHDHSFRLALHTVTTVHIRRRGGKLIGNCRRTDANSVVGGTPVPDL